MIYIPLFRNTLLSRNEAFLITKDVHYCYFLKFSDIPYWQSKGREGLDHAKLTYANIIEKQAKNIIIFVGDGMSLPTLTAARIHKAQRNSEYTAKGEETYLFFETLPHIGLSKVHISKAN